MFLLSIVFFASSWSWSALFQGMFRSLYSWFSTAGLYSLLFSKLPHKKFLACFNILMLLDTVFDIPSSWIATEFDRNPTIWNSFLLVKLLYCIVRSNIPLLYCRGLPWWEGNIYICFDILKMSCIEKSSLHDCICSGLWQTNLLLFFMSLVPLLLNDEIAMLVFPAKIQLQLRHLCYFHRVESRQTMRISDSIQAKRPYLYISMSSIARFNMQTPETLLWSLNFADRPQDNPGTVLWTSCFECPSVFCSQVEDAK